jgi:acetyl esterase/lipase
VKKPRALTLLVLLVLLAGLGGCSGNKLSTQIDDLVVVLWPPERVKHYARNVVYAAPNGHRLTLDVSWPDGPGPFPILVFIHGGSWEEFSKEANEGLARWMTNRGYTVFNINYRLVPEVTVREIVNDAMGAVIFAKDHAAEYHGDPQRVAVAGHSAGAHLATLVAVAAGDPYFTPSYRSTAGNDGRVRAVVAFSGVYDFVGRTPGFDEKKWDRRFGVSYEQNPQVWKKCSPISYVRPDLPPSLVLWGEKDFLRPENENWVAALQAAGASVQGSRVPRADHLWPLWHWSKSALESYRLMLAFLDTHLKLRGGRE